MQMFIGHLPVGYLCTRIMWSTLQKRGLPAPDRRRFLVAGLLASMLPDIDICYFYLIDHRQHLHHSYWTHLPAYWIAIGMLALLLAMASKRKQLIPYLAVVAANVFLHFCLDTIVGKIRWLYPVSKRDFFLFDVPVVHDWWVWSFVLHWTFLFEILVWAMAIYAYTRRSLGFVGIENCAIPCPKGMGESA